MIENDGKGGTGKDSEESEVVTSASSIFERRTMPQAVADKRQPEQTAAGEVTEIPTQVQVVGATHVEVEETAVETWMDSTLPQVAAKFIVEADEQTMVQSESRAVLASSEKESTRALKVERGGQSVQTVQAHADEVARGFPLPAPVSEDLEDDHTEVQAGPFGVGFLPEEHSLGPGFHRVEATDPAPDSVVKQRRPLGGVHAIEATIPTSVPLLKSVAVPAAWDASAAQEVQAHRHLPPQEVALAHRLGSLTGIIRLRSNRWLVVVGLLIVVAGVLVAALLTRDTDVGSDEPARLDRVAPRDSSTPQSGVAEQPALVVADAQTVNVDADAPSRVESKSPETFVDEGVVLVEPVLADAASAENLAKRGRALFKRGKHLPALRLYEKAVVADPNYAAVWRDLGQLHQRRGEWGLASSSYHKYLELAPKARDAQKVRTTIRRMRQR